MTTRHILGICASLRRESLNRALLNCAIELAPDTLQIKTFEGLGDIPPYNQDTQEQGWPAAVEELREKIAGADGLLIASPEYNYSIPGLLKNAIDWVSRTPDQPFKGKPIAIMGASPGNAGTARGQRDIRNPFVFLDGRVMLQPEIMVPAAHQKVEDGRMTDKTTRDFVGKMMAAFDDWIAFHQNRG